MTYVIILEVFCTIMSIIFQAYLSLSDSSLEIAKPKCI